jgi:hypothetical protein
MKSTDRIYKDIVQNETEDFTGDFNGIIGNVTSYRRYKFNQSKELQRKLNEFEFISGI